VVQNSLPKPKDRLVVKKPAMICSLVLHLRVLQSGYDHLSTHILRQLKLMIINLQSKSPSICLNMSLNSALAYANVLLT
jgi:hypothetical protein